MAAWRAELLRKLRKGLSFMMNRKLAVGFATWIERSFGGSEDPMERALRYLLNHHLSRGWLAWMEVWAEKKRKITAVEAYRVRVQRPHRRAPAVRHRRRHDDGVGDERRDDDGVPRGRLVLQRAQAAAERLLGRLPKAKSAWPGFGQSAVNRV